jgi:hypothetical protein
VLSPDFLPIAFTQSSETVSPTGSRSKNYPSFPRIIKPKVKSRTVKRTVAVVILERKPTWILRIGIRPPLVILSTRTKATGITGYDSSVCIAWTARHLLSVRRTVASDSRIITL